MKVRIPSHSRLHREPARAGLPPAVVVCLMLFGLLVVAALILDGKYILQRMAGPKPVADTASGMLVDVATATNRFRDEARAFSIALPDGWRVMNAEETAPYDIRFAGPSLLVIAGQVTPVRYTSIDVLVGLRRNIEPD